MGFKMKYQIKADYIKKGKRRSGTFINPRMGVLHDTGNYGSTADNNRDYYNNTPNDPTSASAHTFIDDLEIIECIPLTTGKAERAFHVRYDVPEDNKIYGDDANDIGAGVELCFGANPKTGRVINFEGAYKRYVWYCAYVSYVFKFNPSLWIGHEKLDPKRKTDPTNALKRYGKTYEQLKADIVKEYNECIEKVAPVVPSPTNTMAPIGVATVLVDELNVREHADFNSCVVGTVKKGEGYLVYAKTNGLYNVGGSQWISAGAEYTKFVPNETPKPVQTTPKRRYVVLPASADTWRVYPVNKAPVKANTKGYLKPSKFGGLEYEIIGNPQADVYTIKTGDFGTVNLYAAPSTGAKIVTK